MKNVPWKQHGTLAVIISTALILFFVSSSLSLRAQLSSDQSTGSGTGTSNIEIAFDSIASPLSGTVSLVALSNMLPDTLTLVIKGPKNEEVDISPSPTLLHTYLWNTALFPNGEYTVEIYATKNGLHDSDSRSVKIQNSTSNISAIKARFIDPPSTISGLTTISASTTFLPDAITFYVKGSGTETLYHVAPNSKNIYSFTWDTTPLKNESHFIKIRAWQNTIYAEDSVSIMVNNATTTGIVLEQPTASTAPPPPLAVRFINQQDTVSGITTLSAKTSVLAEKVTFLIDGTEDAFFTLTSNLSTTIAVTWDTTRFSNGTYSVTVEAIKGRETASTRISTVVSNTPVAQTTPTTQLISETSTPPEQIDQDTSTTAPGDDIPLDLYNESAASNNQETPQVAATTSPITVISTPDTDNTKISLDQSNVTSTTNQTFENPDIKQIPPEDLPPRCKEQKITDAALCARYVFELSLPVNCRGKDIASHEACAAYLDTIKKEYRELPLTQDKLSPATTCRRLGIQTKEACAAHLYGDVSTSAVCDGLTAHQCAVRTNKVLLADFISEDSLKRAQEKITMLSGATIRIKRTQSSQPGAHGLSIRVQRETQIQKTDPSFGDDLDQMIPFGKTDEEIVVHVHPAIESEQTETVTLSAVLLFDRDSDGLTDETENRLGTDPDNLDSDADGFSDGVEIGNSYNPLGEGTIDENSLQPVEKAIVNNKPFEQPKGSTKLPSPDILITEVVNKSDPEITPEQSPQALIFSGTARPNELVTIYIYSTMPIVITVSADANGNWRYELDKSLIDGKHESYVVIQDEEGKIREQSSPLSFFIRDARAVTEDEFIATDVDIITTGSEPLKTSPLFWYIIGGITLIVFGLMLYILNNTLRNRHAVKS